jgi:hypothetical protein
MTTADFKNLFSDSSEAELRRSSIRLDAMIRGMWIPGGADGRQLSVPTLARLNTGLALPEGVRLESRPTPIDFVGTFVSLEDYLDPSETPGGSPEAVAEQILASQDPRVLLLQLAYLNHLCNISGQINRFVVVYRDALRPDLRAGFNEALEKESEEDQHSLLFARQPVLAAIRAVLEAYPWPQEGLEEPSLADAILLAHAVGSSLREGQGHGAQTIGVLPADLMMELVRIGMLYEQDDDYSVIDRTLRYWREHILNLERTELREDTRLLLEEALGVPFEDFFALGLWVWLQARNRDPLNAQSTMTLPVGLPGVALPREHVKRFLDAVSATPEWFATEFDGRDSQYDFLPIQARPVLRLEGNMGEQLLVLDEPFLLHKFTLTGLFWAVHDNERDHHSDLDRRRWTQAHGEAVESMVEERLREMAPSLPGSGRDKSFYTEEDLKEAYPGEKAGDAVVDYGDRVLVFEVVGGQPVVGTRVSGDPESFERDTEKLVLKKARQLDGACASLVTDQKRLTGYGPPPNRRIVPIVVVAGSYPSDALSRSHVDNLLVDKGLLQDPVIDPLCILNLGELEMIESLHEAGRSPGELLARWRRSGLRNVSFRNFVLRQVDANLARPARMKKRVDAEKHNLARHLAER